MHQKEITPSKSNCDSKFIIGSPPLSVLLVPFVTGGTAKRVLDQWILLYPVLHNSGVAGRRCSHVGRA